MSNWTHAAGIVRVDHIRAFGEIDFDKVFGRECLWDSPDEVWDEYDNHPERFMPMGSEGSLQKSVWVNPKKSHLAAYTVSVFGDLRDHHDPQEIIDWFAEACRKVDARNAVIVVENEINGRKEWSI